MKTLLIVAALCMFANSQSFAGETFKNQSFNQLRGGEGVGGGDEVGLDFQKSLQLALEDIRVLQPSVYQELESKGFLAKMAKTKIVVADETLGVESLAYLQFSVAANIPQANTIFINRARWKAITESNSKKAIALHEGLSLARMESTGNYQISGRYLADLGISESDLTAILTTKPSSSAIAPRGVPRYEKSREQRLDESKQEAENAINLICEGYFANEKQTKMIELLGNALYKIVSYQTELDGGPEWKQADEASSELYFIQREAFKGVDSNYKRMIAAYCKK